MFGAVLDDVPPVRTPSGRRRTRPGKVHADKGYDSRANRAYLRQRGIRARIARREVESSRRLGRHRWTVERSLSWLSCFRRLAVRWDRDAGGGGSPSCWWPVRWCASTGSKRSEGVTRRLSPGMVQAVPARRAAGVDGVVVEAAAPPLPSRLR